MYSNRGAGLTQRYRGGTEEAREMKMDAKSWQVAATKEGTTKYTNYTKRREKPRINTDENTDVKAKNVAAKTSCWRLVLRMKRSAACGGKKRL